MGLLSGIIFFIFPLAQALATTCPHEAISTKVYEDNIIEIYSESVLSSGTLGENDIKELIRKYREVANYFKKINKPKVSISLITAEGFKSSYPSLNMNRWGFSLATKYCSKKTLFLRVRKPEGLTSSLPPSFYYTFIHELFHIFRYEIDPENFENNFWSEEGMADHIAYKHTDETQPPIFFIAPYLNAPAPMKLFGTRHDYNQTNDAKASRSFYGQSFLFFDFLERRLSDGYDMSDIYTLKNPTLDNLSHFFNTTNHASQSANANNVFLNFTHPYYGTTSVSQAMFMEFVIKLLIPRYYAFYDPFITKTSFNASVGILPAGYSFANVPLGKFAIPDYKPTLEMKKNDNSLPTPDDGKTIALVIFWRTVGSRPFSVASYESFLEFLKTKRSEVSSATLVLINMSNKDMSYSINE